MTDLQMDLQNVILLLGDILDRPDLTEDQRSEITSCKLDLENIEESL